MFQAKTATGEIITLEGSLWIGRQVSVDEAATLVPNLSCITDGCTQPLQLTAKPHRFLHPIWKDSCRLGRYNEIHGYGHRSWVRQQIIQEFPHKSTTALAAGLVPVSGGMSVALRDLDPGGHSNFRPYAEHGVDAERGFASMWLLNGANIGDRGEMLQWWMQGFFRSVLKTSFPVSVGFVWKKRIWFVGDLKLERTEEREELRVISRTDSVSVEAMHWWAGQLHSKAPMPPELADDVALLNAVSQRKIQLAR